jgi:putative ABC transport system permease protein
VPHPKVPRRDEKATVALNRFSLREFVRLALEALGRYKLRTTLSVLGVVLGVAAVIAMMSVSEGAARQALAEVEYLGLDNIVARSHGSSLNPGSWRSIVASDADRIQAGLPTARYVTPLLQRFSEVSQGNKKHHSLILGVRQPFQSIVRLTMSRGRFLALSDDVSMANVCVLGATLARQLFGFRNPIGDRVTIGGRYYQVVGVLQDKRPSEDAGGSLAWHEFDRAVMMPFATLSRRSLEIAPNQPADEIWVQVEAGERTDELGRTFERILNARADNRDFTVVVPRELLAQRYRTQRTFSVVVGSVAAIALLVGGIGIMNIMLTSVVERTHEIGVRRTVGATRRDVTLQFLTETLLMTLSGGIAGIAIGVGVSIGISSYAGWVTYVSATAVTLAVVVSFAVGLVFGIYPAIKAATLQPVDALRYE